MIRSSHIFIQCIGRVLRIFGDKKYGLIIDGYINDHNYESTISRKLIGYYVAFHCMNNNNNDKKIEFEQVMNNIDFKVKNSEIIIRLGNVDLEIECAKLKWSSQIIDNFKSLLEEEIYEDDEVDLTDEYKKLKEDVKKYKFNDKKQYMLEPLFIPDPEIKYAGIFEGWHTFLSIDCTNYPNDKISWKNQCIELRIRTKDRYYNLAVQHNLPLMPEELYDNFSNVQNELI